MIRFLFIILFFTSYYAQDSFEKLDFESLKNLYEKENNVKFIETYLSKAIKLKDSSEIAYAYSKLGYHYVKDSKKAITYLNNGIFHCKKNDFKLLAKLYFIKANVLYYTNNIKESLDNTLIAEKYAQKINNENYYYTIRNFIGVIKSEKLGEIEEALKIYNECLRYYDKNIKENREMFLRILFNKADAFKSIHLNDSSTHYNKLGYLKSVEFNYPKMKDLFILNEGANLVDQKRFIPALDSINKSQKNILKTNDYGNILASFYYKAKCYKGLNNNKEAVQNFLKVDSMYHKNDYITPEFIEGYPYLINHYEKNGDKNNQIKFLKIYQKLETEFREKYRETYKKIKEQYEIPNIIKEKDKEISFSNILSYVSIVVALFGISFGAWNYYLNKRNKNRFVKIIEESLQWQKYPLQLESGEIIDVDYKVVDEINSITNTKKEHKSSEISKEIVDKILIGLKEFERNKSFLQKSITSQIIAEQLNTNYRYLSIVINDFKGMKVNDYINDLRIEYAVLILQKDRKIRRYNLEALADEFGFNTPKSFSNSFVKKTGIKPTFFIKSIDK